MEKHSVCRFFWTFFVFYLVSVLVQTQSMPLCCLSVHMFLEIGRIGWSHLVKFTTQGLFFPLWWSFLSNPLCWTDWDIYRYSLFSVMLRPHRACPVHRQCRSAILSWKRLSAKYWSSANCESCSRFWETWCHRIPIWHKLQLFISPLWSISNH